MCGYFKEPITFKLKVINYFHQLMELWNKALNIRKVPEKRNKTYQSELL